MGQFFKFLFASCLGTILAIFAFFIIILWIGSSKFAQQMSDPTVQISDNSILKINIPSQLPEQTNNVEVDGFSFRKEKILGVHDLAKAITIASTDSKIKGIYLPPGYQSHGYATLKVIRDALLEFKKSGKFIYSYSNYYDHKNYYLASVSDQISIHPLGFIDLKGFGASIPFFTEFMEKIGLSYNIYYAGEFKSATEPFRLSKMSPENRLQLREYLNSQLSIYCDQLAESRNINKDDLRKNFDQFLSYSAPRAVQNNLIDKIEYEQNILEAMRSKMDISSDKKLNFVTQEEYFNAKDNDKNYSSTKIAVIFAEGNIIDQKGSEGEIGKKYIKIIRDIRTNDKVKAIVLRVNSPGGSAMMSDELLNELDLTKSAGKPIVVSMGDYAASGGYYISCHADSIFASPHTQTGSIGVFAMIPNFKKMTDEKIGIDFDTVGTGPMANTFDLTSNWGESENKILQENINHVYETFLNVVSKGRNLSIEKTKELAKGRIWAGPKAVELGLVSRLGSLQDAINAAAKLASLEKFQISEYPTQPDPLQKILDKFQDKNEETNLWLESKILKENLGPLYPYYEEWKNINKLKGPQMRLPIKVVY